MAETIPTCQDCLRSATLRGFPWHGLCTCRCLLSCLKRVSTCPAEGQDTRLAYRLQSGSAGFNKGSDGCSSQTRERQVIDRAPRSLGFSESDFTSRIEAVEAEAQACSSNSFSTLPNAGVEGERWVLGLGCDRLLHALRLWRSVGWLSLPFFLRCQVSSCDSSLCCASRTSIGNLGAPEGGEWRCGDLESRRMNRHAIFVQRLCPRPPLSPGLCRSRSKGAFEGVKGVLTNAQERQESELSRRIIDM